MQLAIDVAGFTPARPTSCAGRWAPSARRERMAAHHGPALRRAWPRNGITGDLADDIFVKLAAFANYGFPESHAISFAYLVYASAWLKRYHPAAFCAALLNAQPMGFYSPQTLVDDARRHGVTVLRPDINASDAKATLEAARLAGGQRRGEPPHDWGMDGPRVRLGLARSVPSATTLGRAASRPERRAATARTATWPIWPGGPGSTDRAPGGAGHRGRVRRLRPHAGGRRCGRPARRRRSRPDRLPGTTTGLDAPTLPGMDDGRRAGRRRVGHRPVARTAIRSQFIRERPRRARRAADRPTLATVEHGTPGPGRRHRHAPAAAGDRGRGHVPQPGGRDRHAQRHLLAGAVAAVPAGGPDQRGAGRAGPAGERPRGC